jgi:trimeric autotransporter adhesin
MLKRSVFLSTVFGLALATAALAQTGVPSADRIIRFAGSVAGASAGAQTLRFAVYDEETGGNLLWEEVQTAAVDAAGNFTVFLGGTSTDGLPVALFANGAPRWLSVEPAGTTAGPRVLLAAVPYAVSAANATSLGGRPATDYLLTPQARAAATAGTSGAATADREPLPLVNNGTANYIGKFFNSVDLINSQLYDNGTNVGVGTTNPFDKFHVQFTNNAGSLTGYAVQNLSSGANAYSGMLFYDHTGTLRQFQGYNNSTGEYRINNISPSGSINFMIGSDSKFKVATSGDIALSSGTNTPTQRLENFGTSQNDVTFISRRHSGTISAPAATPSGANLFRFEGAGHNGSAFTSEKGYLQIISTQAWTTTANGTEINFATTPNNSTTSSVRMTIANDGRVGINRAPGSWPVNTSIGYGIDIAAAPGESFAVANVSGTTAGYLNLNGGDFSGIWLNNSDVDQWRIINDGTNSAGAGTNALTIRDAATTTRLSIAQGGATTITGGLVVSGAFTASGAKSFTIDHPLDPENMVLRHAAAESNEVINFYSGNVTTDAAGKATVGLPAYFEAINKDYRYQLTVIGTFAQAIVSREVADNRFEITTSQPNVKVSWEVKGVRNDQYMRDNPYISEEAKPTTAAAAVDASGRPTKR